MTKVVTNTSKYPKHIHSIQLKCLHNFKNRNKSIIHYNKWRDSQSLLHCNINNFIMFLKVINFIMLSILIINHYSINMLILDVHLTLKYLLY